MGKPDQHVIREDRAVRSDNPLYRGVADVSFVPEGDILHGGEGVTNGHARSPSLPRAGTCFLVIRARSTSDMPFSSVSGLKNNMTGVTEELIAEVKNLIIERLKLEEITAADIITDAPLFGEGLGLDSIDALELVIGLEKE